MADWFLDPVTGDLVVTDDVRFTSKLETVVQSITLRSNAFKGEWFMDLDNGLLEFDTDGSIKQGDTTIVLGGKYNQAKLSAAFRRMLVNTTGVDKVTKLLVSFDGTTRTTTIDWEVKAGDDFISGSNDI